jgi:PEP-CTERM motif
MAGNMEERRGGRTPSSREVIMTRSVSYCAAIIGAILLWMSASPAGAVSFSTAYRDGGTWNTNYAQGFSPSVSPNPDLGIPFISNGLATQVFLKQFQFFKSGTADSASNIQLAIVNSMYPQLSLNASNQYYLPTNTIVGLSTNTITSTSTIATGQPITFSFNALPLSYGNSYAANFVSVGTDGNAYPVLVSSLTANYALNASDNAYHPVTNYGSETQYQYSTTNFITNGFYNGYSFGGDANFAATYDYLVRGDFNGDGVFDSKDLPAMLQALTNVSGYKLTNSLSDPEMVALGDFDGDTLFTNADIQGMLSAIVSAGGAATPALKAVPEPGSFSLLGVGLLSFCAWRKGRRQSGRNLLEILPT